MLESHASITYFFNVIINIDQKEVL